MAYQGVEPLDGRPTHVLRMTVFSGTLLDSLTAVTPLLESLTPEEIRLYLDTTTYVPRRVTTVGTAVQGGREREIRRSSGCRRSRRKGSPSGPRPWS